MKRLLIACLTGLVFALPLYADEAGSSSEIEPNSLRNWLLSKVDKAAERRAADVAALDSPESIAARQQTLRDKFVAALGGFPDRTPLHAKVVDRVARDGYHVEKILFESQPGFHVTAAIFLPDESQFAPPWPGVLVACGHSANGKALDTYQRGCALAALNGMAALIFDPIEQGERGRGGTRGHNAIGLPAVLVGSNTARIEIWDGMRAIDYLETRDDIRKDHIGCMGNSGGGTQTAYLMALDDRIRAAAPACYISTLPHVTRAIGPQDAEQNIFGQLAFGMDHPDYLTMRAPSPALVAAATKDFFPIAGARAAYAEAQTIFDKLGHADRVAMVEHDAGHGWAKPLREVSVRWMTRWLRDVDRPVVEPDDLQVLSDAQMQVTEQGHVNKLPGARSAFDLLREELANKPAPPRRTPEQLARVVARRAGIREAGKRAALTVRFRAEPTETSDAAVRIVFDHEGMPLPALLRTPTAATTAPPVLLVHDEGNEAARPLAAELAAAGRLVLSIDLRGFGETANAKKNFYGESDGGDAYLAYLLGSSLVGQRAEDILAAAQWLANERQRLSEEAESAAGEIELIAVGWGTTPALHAAVVDAARFAKVTLREPTRGWSEVLADEGPHRFSDVVHGALGDYEHSDLRAAIGARLGD